MESYRQKRAAHMRKRRAERTPEEVQADNRAMQLRRRQHLVNDPNNRILENLRRRKVPPPSKYSARNANNFPPLHELGDRIFPCPECNALHFKAEKTSKGKFSSCCAGGLIKLPALNEYPPQLKSWLSGDSQDCRHFRTNIRKYNGAFAFASFGYQPVHFTSGPQAFAIHGQVYHTTASSLDNTENKAYAQLYILDPEFANQARIQNDHNNGCKERFFVCIDNLIREINPYANAFKMMRNVMQRYQDQNTVQMWITKDRNHDPRRYNLPVANEVAAVFVSEDGEPPFARDIAVHPLGDAGLQNLSILSPNCDPMVYPLLFPHGDQGWQIGLQKSGNTDADLNENSDNYDNDERKRKTVSMLEFYSYRLQERNSFNPLLHAGKLTQQFIVDAFLKVEGQRIQWNRMNQKKLRVDLYMGLMDFVNNQAEKRDLKAGRIVILPSSFTGGKRYMQQNYQDAMVLVAKFGKPDLFITFTCNPKWKEISSNLQPNETAIDRPDLVATVFNLKLQEFMNDMTSDKGGVLGKVVAYLYVIEFQKRGMR